MGGGYNWTSLDFSHGQQRSGISAIQCFANYQLNRSWSLSGWAGPEYITAKTIIVFQGQLCDLVPATTGFRLSAVNIGWQGLRDSFTIGASRQVSDGGGLWPPPPCISLNGAYRRKLTCALGWYCQLAVTVTMPRSLPANLNRQLFPNRTYTMLQAAVQLTRQITPRTDGQSVVRLYP